jgi:hypothetical protein
MKQRQRHGATQEGSVTRCGGVTTSTEGDAAPGREKGEDDVSSADANPTRLKNKENSHGRFDWYKWTMKI